MKKYVCNACGHVYDPAEGDPASNIQPGTPFSALPDDWYCPDCGAAKADFEPVEEEDARP
jgi:rubredoxin